MIAAAAEILLAVLGVDAALSVGAAYPVALHYTAYARLPVRDHSDRRVAADQA